MIKRYKVLSLAVAIFALHTIGCGSQPTAPALYTSPGLARERVPNVDVSLLMDPTVAGGDSIKFIIKAHNSGGARVQIGEQCGPPMDVLITLPSGQLRSALYDRLGQNGAFTCELAPYHFVEAHADNVIVIAWKPPANAHGSYSAVAGLRRSDGLSNVSDAVAFKN